jgi:DNA-binding MarR family transcriptional regulator
MAGKATNSASNVAVELMTAMTRLRARLRIESAPTEMGWTWAQLTTLGRIVSDGPMTTSGLAQAEHVRRQSMAETVAALHADGLICFAPDPTDGRKSLISATAKGKMLSKTIPAAREDWLTNAFHTLLEPSELQTLLKAAAVMNHIADSNT